MPTTIHRWLLREFFAERGELSGNNLKVAHRITVRSVARVNQVCNQSRLRSMCRRKRMPRPAPVCARFNQTRQIGNYKRAATGSFRWFSGISVRGNHTEAWLESRERIIGNFSDAQLKYVRSVWTCPRSEIRRVPHRPAILVQIAGFALVRPVRLQIRGAPDATAWRSAGCRARLFHPAPPICAVPASPSPRFVPLYFDR